MKFSIKPNKELSALFALIALAELTTILKDPQANKLRLYKDPCLLRLIPLPTKDCYKKFIELYKKAGHPYQLCTAFLEVDNPHSLSKKPEKVKELQQLVRAYCEETYSKYYVPINKRELEAISYINRILPYLKKLFVRTEQYVRVGLPPKCIVHPCLFSLGHGFGLQKADCRLIVMPSVLKRAVSTRYFFLHEIIHKLTHFLEDNDIISKKLNKKFKTGPSPGIEWNFDEKNYGNPQSLLNEALNRAVVFRVAQMTGDNPSDLDHQKDFWCVKELLEALKNDYEINKYKNIRDFASKWCENNLLK